jgi:N4-gp56 family major capsid protein
VIITGTGAAQIPPATPGNGLTVYPTFLFGRGAYTQVDLDEIKITALLDPDKSDPLNQLRVVGWKVFYGTMITNQQFFMRLEGLSNFSATFS